MYDMFKLFQTGRSHMVLLTEPPAAQQPAAADGPQTAAAVDGGKPTGAPFSPRPAVLGHGDCSGLPLGIITIEDVIEELMQTEIGARRAGA
jgi:metal transporter CNNM